jgi:hypothetical protein
MGIQLSFFEAGEIAPLLIVGLHRYLNVPDRKRTIQSVTERTEMPKELPLGPQKRQTTFYATSVTFVKR